MAAKREFTFDSKDGRTQIHAIAWTPETGRTEGVLQIVHGMQEFAERYESFAEFMTEKGFAVVGHDHLGHGMSIVSKEDYGFFCEEDGNKIVLQDIYQLMRMTREQYPSVPYYILGHSMGSFLLRQFLYTYGREIDGAIVMGTGTQPESILKLAKGMCRVQACFKGWHYRSGLIDKMAFGGYNKHFQPARTRADWLTRDESIVDRYLADERCTFRFTLNGFYNLFTSIEAAGRMENLRKMPKDLPVIFVAGAQDPVGNYGKGVEKVRKKFQEAGMTDVTWMLYEEDRHEVLNELDREKVYKDLYAWLYVRMTEALRKREKTGDEKNEKENVIVIDGAGITA